MQKYTEELLVAIGKSLTWGLLNVAQTKTRRENDKVSRRAVFTADSATARPAAGYQQDERLLPRK